MLFSEVYSTYFNAVAAIVDAALAGEISDSRLREIIDENAFSESMLSIEPALKNEDWLVITKELQTPIRRSPQMPLTLLQRRWLKGLLSDPRVALFAVDATGLEGVDPLFSPDDFVFFDRYSDGDPFEDDAYIRHFRTILMALKQRRRVRVSYINRKGEPVHANPLPMKLEYSSKDDKFRLLTDGGKGAAYINLARITECELLEPCDSNDVRPPRHKERSVSFTLTDQRKALDRVMLHFCDCRKTTQRTGENTYHVELWYDQMDETEILIRILSFGPMIQVTGPHRFVTLVKGRLRMQNKFLS